MMPEEPPKAGLMPSLPEKVWTPDLSMAEVAMTLLVNLVMSSIWSCGHTHQRGDRHVHRQRTRNEGKRRSASPAIH